MRKDYKPGLSDDVLGADDGEAGSGGLLERLEGEVDGGAQVAANCRSPRWSGWHFGVSSGARTAFGGGFGRALFPTAQCKAPPVKE